MAHTEVLLINPLYLCAYALTAFQEMTSLLKDIYWSYNSLTIGGQLAPSDLLTLFSAAINFDTSPQWLQLAVILDTKPLNTPMVEKYFKTSVTFSLDRTHLRISTPVDNKLIRCCLQLIECTSELPNGVKNFLSAPFYPSLIKEALQSMDDL